VQAVQEIEGERDGNQPDQDRKTKMSIHGGGLDLFDHDRVDLVGDVVEAVGDFL
jgi:hypothetical protein